MNEKIEGIYEVKTQQIHLKLGTKNQEVARVKWTLKNITTSEEYTIGVKPEIITNKEYKQDGISVVEPTKTLLTVQGLPDWVKKETWVGQEVKGFIRTFINAEGQRVFWLRWTDLDKFELVD